MQRERQNCGTTNESRNENDGNVSAGDFKVERTLRDLVLNFRNDEITTLEF